MNLAIILFGSFVMCRVLVIIMAGKSFTGFIRNHYHWQVHHLHIGILLLVCSFIIIGLDGVTNSLIYSGLIGTALILDEFFCFIFDVKYFSRKEFLPTTILFICLSVTLLLG